MGISGTVLFFTSLLLHKISHSLVAKTKDIPVEGITLFAFGGVSRTRMDAETPGDEFQIAVVGPLTSLALSGIFALVSYIGGNAGWDITITGVAAYLAWIDLVLAIFNLLPGFPLDGGRLFRSTVLRKETYQTKTLGERVQPAARPVGEGIYEIVRHGGHTNLVYVLELPEDLGEAQEDLGIKQEASYIITIKNPESSSPQGMGLPAEDKVDLPEHLQSRFQERRFAIADPPEFLDYPGVELILIGASADISEELEIELDPATETEDTAEILNDLRMRKSRHPIEPLFTGEWR